jgi:S1-C subfamily serine protease
MRMLLRFGATALGFAVLFPFAASAQSFNCRTADRPDEVLICQDSRLSALDERLSELYFDLRNRLRGSERRTLEGAQTAWLASRMACGRDYQCIEARYQQRINQLGGRSNAPEQTADEPGNRGGGRRAEPKNEQPKDDQTNGTGFFIDRSRVLTNFHVVDGCTIVTLTIPGSPSGSGQVVATDPTNDLALIAVNDAANTSIRPVVVPGLRNRVHVGETVYAFGYPLPGLLSSSGNFTAGSISSLSGLGDDVRNMQISAPVQPGNSGGPLLDVSANVIGVVVGKLNAGQVSQLIEDIPQNVNFAIKASVAISFLEANSVTPSPPTSAVLHATDVAEKARQFSLQVTCKR